MFQEPEEIMTMVEIKKVLEGVEYYMAETGEALKSILDNNFNDTTELSSAVMNADEYVSICQDIEGAFTKVLEMYLTLLLEAAKQECASQRLIIKAVVDENGEMLRNHKSTLNSLADAHYYEQYYDDGELDRDGIAGLRQCIYVLINSGLENCRKLIGMLETPHC